MIRSLPSSLDRARDYAEPALRDAVRRLNPEIVPVIQYHLGWADADGNEIPGGGGKGIRPALAILSAEATGTLASVGVPGAVAVELVHNFSLLHDDVIDGDRERRHRPTVWALYGVGEAIIAGDALLTLAVRVLLESGTIAATRAASSLVRATDSMIAGQAVDMALESRLDVDLDECLDMAAGKTGALLACAASIGALLADADQRVVESLADFGRNLGLAFQAVDDLLGIWGRPEITGKPVWNDLRQQKKSLPVVFALTRGNGKSEELREILTNGSIEERDVVRAARLVERCGGRELTESVAQRHLDLALAALEREALEPSAHDELVEIARFVTTREL